MAQVPRAFGPLENIVNVAWAKGCFLLITVKAFYQDDGVEPFKKTIAVVLTKQGIDAGGVILGQKTFHVPEHLDPPDAEEGEEGEDPHPAFTIFRAVLRFNRALKEPVDAAFYINLKGTEVFEDTNTPPPTLGEFCGVSTSTQSGSPYEVRVVNSYFDFILGHVVEQLGLFQTISFSSSSPAGAESGSWDYQVANVRIPEDVGKGAYTHSGTSSEIWYRDAFGNYVNTHRPCSELQPPGTPTTSQRVDGFDYIEIKSFEKLGHKAMPVSSWDAYEPETNFIRRVSKAVAPAPAITRFTVTVPQRITGLNSDFYPIYTDLGDGAYDFNLAALGFDNVPSPVRTRYLAFATIPLSPVTARYHVLAYASRQPFEEYQPPLEQYPGTLSAPPIEKFFEARVPPPSNQPFNPTP